MELYTKDVELALDIIHHVDLPHPIPSLLGRFVEDAVNRDTAAKYFLKECCRGEEANLPMLMGFLARWTELVTDFVHDGPLHPTPDKELAAKVTQRDGGTCFLTGLKDSYWDPLGVYPIFPKTKGNVIERQSDMVEAFLTPELKDWLLSNRGVSKGEDHFLLRKSAAKAFSQGLVKLLFLPECEYYTIDVQDTQTTSRESGIAKKIRAATQQVDDPCDPSKWNAIKPIQEALTTLSHFGDSMSWIRTGRKMQTKRPGARRWSILACFQPLTRPLGTLLWALWKRAPEPVRFRAYQLMARVGQRLCGPCASYSVQHLPFGMRLRSTSVEGRGMLDNEWAALDLVHRHSTTPVPRPLDLVSDSKTSFLLTTRVSGVPLGWCLSTMDEAEVAILVRDLQTFIADLRAIGRDDPAAEPTITNAIGKGFHHPRRYFGHKDEGEYDAVGPFVNEEQFNNVVSGPYPVEDKHRSGHSILFSHGGLNTRNIFIKDGKLSGVVDWHRAGWYPEYWDSTQVPWGTVCDWRFRGIAERVFAPLGDYTYEHKVELGLRMGNCTY